MRLKDKIAIVVGAGQTPGQTIGNGRATAITFAREGARVLCADRDLASAEETVAEIARGDGEAVALAADVTDEASLAAMVEDCVARWGRIDVLHNNVGVCMAGGDKVLEEITADSFDNVMAINLRGMVMTCKLAVPVMLRQGSGAIVNISSTAARGLNPFVAYRASKAGVIAFTQQLAFRYAGDGIRANCILPGLMDTPMAIEERVRNWGQSHEKVRADRDAQVPLRHKMGTAWDVANAALFLASDEASFVSGVSLPVDGGALVFVGPAGGRAPGDS